MTARLRHRASAARTAATSPSGCSPMASRCMPSPTPPSRSRTCPAWICTAATWPTLEETRRLVIDLAPDEIYNLAALSSVARSWGEPDLTAQVNGAAAVALLESAWQSQEKSGRPVRFVQASSAEIFGQPRRAHPRTRPPRSDPVNPYGAAKAYAHLMVDVYRQRGLHAVSAILYNHESPRRPAQFVTRKITSTVAAIARGRAERSDPRQPRRPARLGLGSRLRRRHGARGTRGGGTATTSSPPASATPCATSSRPPSRRAGVEDWEGLVDVDPAFFRPADPTELVGDATRAKQRAGVDTHRRLRGDRRSDGRRRSGTTASSLTLEVSGDADQRAQAGRRRDRRTPRS